MGKRRSGIAARLEERCRIRAIQSQNGYLGRHFIRKTTTPCTRQGNAANGTLPPAKTTVIMNLLTLSSPPNWGGEQGLCWDVICLTLIQINLILNQSMQIGDGYD